VRFWISSALALAVLTAVPVAGQSKALPRSKDGKPDFSGLWGASGYAANIAKDIGQLPMRPDAAKLFQERQATHGKGDPERTCLPDGIPRSDSLGFKIVHNPDLLLILYEGNVHTYRQVLMVGRGHPGDLDPTWYGHSIGKWDGDTIVVDTVSQNGKTWLDQAGHPTTDKMHVTERFSRRGLGHLRVAITIDDPGVYTRPWTVAEVSPLIENREVREFLCNEAEINARHLLPR
jgi:hypothetical protein